MVPRQQGYREPAEFFPFDLVRSVEKRPDGDKIIEGQSEVGLQVIEPLLGNAVEGGLGVLVFKTSQGGEDHRAQGETDSDNA
jgi:hypothetical protein